MKSIQVVKIQMVKESRMKYEIEDVVFSPAKVAFIAREFIGNSDREHCIVLCLDSKNKINSINTLSIGSLNSSIVNPREVFKTAILSNAASVILAHNHPSGDPTPSNDDISMTQRLAEAGAILGIDVIDHVIVGDGSNFVSLKKQSYI